MHTQDAADWGERYMTGEERDGVVTEKTNDHISRPGKMVTPEKKKEELKYFSVQMHYRQEVCVKAKDENEAEEIASNADFSTSAIDLEEVEAEEMYNDPGDERLVEEFKSDDKYAESE
jgi:hypothetical protein